MSLTIKDVTRTCWAHAHHIGGVAEQSLAEDSYKKVRKLARSYGLVTKLTLSLLPTVSWDKNPLAEFDNALNNMGAPYISIKGKHGDELHCRPEDAALARVVVSCALPEIVWSEYWLPAIEEQARAQAAKALKAAAHGLTRVA